MADINLNFQGSTTFGGKFPNVFIKSIDVQPYPGRPTSLAAKFEVKLNLKFTKPKDLSASDVEEFIYQELRLLRLYAYVIPSLAFCNQLENNTFSIQKYMDHLADSDMDLPSESVLSEKIDLVDLITETDDGGAGAVVTVSDVFDSEGNEIVEVSNITYVFEHYGVLSSEVPELTTWQGEEVHPIENIEKYFFAAFVGHSDHVTALDPDMNEMMYNSHFGNITYYHMLTKGNLASRFYRAYVYDNNEPYYGIVLQNINGKFYSTENYTFEDIKNTFLSTIDEYRDKRDGDPTLNKDIQDLEAIIMSDQNKTNILGEIANYQSVYPNKDQATLSGLFYNSFVVAFSEVLATLGAQRQVFQKLYLDSLITDSRATLLSGVYTPPTIPVEYDWETAGYPVEFVRGIPAEGVWPDGFGWHISKFIDEKKFMCTRESIAVKPFFDASGYYTGALPMGATAASFERLIAGLPSTLTGAGGSTMVSAEPYTTYTGLSGEYGELWYALYRKYLLGIDSEGREPGDDGYSGTGVLDATMAAELATTELEYMLSGGHYDGTYLGAAKHLWGADELGSSIEDVVFTGTWALPSSPTGDIMVLDEAARHLNFIVKQKGCWFFDYEAAVRTQSAIAKVLNITKLQQHFRLNIPYAHFYFEMASMERHEMMLHHDGEASDGTPESIKCTIYADFPKMSGEYEGKYLVYTSAPGGPATSVWQSKPKLPLMRSTGLQWEADPITGDAGDYIDMDYHRYKYLRPYTETLTGTVHYPSLIFKNFDLPANADGSNQLINYNSLASFPDSYPLGKKTLDGYRLTCFKFADLLDDDVAYYNTDSSYLAANPGRRDQIKTLNPLNKGSTVYKLKVKIIDRTKSTLDDLYDYCNSIVSEYSTYVDEARDICSYNNITNTYNDYFVQALNEKYYEERPWVKAAYIAVALADMLFSSVDTPKDQFDAAVITETLKISPGTGNLASTVQFLETLELLVDYLVSGGVVGDSPGNNIVGGTGDILWFGNPCFDFAELSEITGDYFPSDVDDAMVWGGAHEIAPLIILPDVVFFGGHDMTITGEEWGFDTTDLTLDARIEGYAGYVGLVGVRELTGLPARQAYDDASHSDDISAYSEGIISGPFGELSTKHFRFTNDDGTVHELADTDRTRNNYIQIQDPTRDNLTKAAYDEIFLPLNDDDWRSILFSVNQRPDGDIYFNWHRTTHTYTGTSTPYLPSMDTYNIEARLKWRPAESDGKPKYGFYDIPTGITDHSYWWDGDYPSLGAYMQQYVYTFAARLAHEMLARSTVDVDLDPRGQIEGHGWRAKRKHNSNRPRARRTDRDLTELKYLIETYYLPEAERRIDEEDDDRYSLIIRGRQNYEEYKFRSSHMLTGEDPIEIHRRIRDALELMLDVIDDEIAIPTEAHSPRGAATMGMSYVLNDCDPSTASYTGPGDFDARYREYDTED